MKKNERSKLTEEVKMTKTSFVIPSLARDLKKAAEILKNGGVVIFPTDTVYGIGCLYDDNDALERIYKIKNRPKGQPFPYLVSKTSQVEKLAIVTPLSRKLMDQHWPGGLTIVLNSKIASERIGFRMPNSSLINLLISSVGKPIIGTSANFHTQPSVATSRQLDPKLRQLVDFVVEGKSKMGIESTVIDTTVSPPKILRQGAVKIKIRSI